MYGLNNKVSENFGRQCLLARRLVEQGVRFVQIFAGGWDSHDYLERGHSSRIATVDQPWAALIKDLKRRGMLEDTLVIWTGGIWTYLRTTTCEVVFIPSAEVTTLMP